MNQPIISISIYDIFRRIYNFCSYCESIIKPQQKPKHSINNKPKLILDDDDVKILTVEVEIQGDYHKLIDQEEIKREKKEWRVV
jgi:hypothetical protein